MSLPGGWEWLIILLFVLIFFGAKRLPEIARGLGKGIREFKNAIGGISDEIQKAGNIADQADTAPSTPPPPPETSEEPKAEPEEGKDADEA